MGFGKDLAKGLVRSAVNQVGRDAGKVVSNQLYGDAHSVPHRSVSGQPEFVGTNEHEVRVERCEPTSSTRVFFYVFVAFLFNFIGAVALLISGYSRWQSRHRIKGWRVYSVPTYASDRRYRNGVRYEGDVLRRELIMLDADEWELERNTTVARTYLFCGVAILLFLVVMVFIGGQGK